MWYNITNGICVGERGQLLNKSLIYLWTCVHTPPPLQINVIAACCSPFACWWLLKCASLSTELEIAFCEHVQVLARYMCTCTLQGLVQTSHPSHMLTECSFWFGRETRIYLWTCVHITPPLRTHMYLARTCTNLHNQDISLMWYLNGLLSYVRWLTLIGWFYLYTYVYIWVCAITYLIDL